MSLRDEHRLRAALAADDELTTLLLVGLLCGTIAFKAKYLADLLGLALQNRSLTYTEGINAILATRPELWYQTFATAPHLPTIYPPGYHALVGVLTWATPLGVFQVMHLVGLGAGLGGGLAIAAILREHDVGLPVALLGGGLYGLSAVATGGTVLGRVDHLGVFVGLLAIHAATRRGRGDPWTAALLTVAAMYVKHSLLAVPVAIAAFYWLGGWRRDAIAYAVATATVGLGLLAIGTALTDGRMLHHLVGLNASQPWHLELSAGVTGWLAFTHAGLWLLCGVALVHLHREAEVLRWDVVFLAVAAALAIATAGKPGSWSGYFLPPIAAAAIVVARCLDARLDRWTTAAGMAVLFVLVLQFGAYAVWQPPPEYDAAGQAGALAEIEGLDGPILTSDNGLLVDTGTGEPYEAQLIRTLDDDARPDGVWVVDRIRTHEYDAIVLRLEAAEPYAGSRWSSAQLRVIDEEYVLVATHGRYRVYRPR